MNKVHIISLGCPKNLVDSETIVGILSNNGYVLSGESKLADIIIINTCAFIDKARKEAYTTINQVSNKKSKYQKLIVCGCLPQLEKEQLFKKFPQIDALLGTSEFVKISKILGSFNYRNTPFLQIGKPNFILSDEPKLFSTPKSYAYIKIADGCNNRCSYCIIPKLRGNFRSRKIEHIINDVRDAVKTSRKEVVLIGQDTTMYGVDIYGKLMLPSLLKKIARIKGLKWIRLLYTHPAHFTDELITEIAENEKVCKYVDIPIQHTDDFILRKMERSSSKMIFSTIEKLRKKMPDIALRTTIIAGFPGETEKSFSKLLSDINQLQFDWLGGFEYCPQKGTTAYTINDSVSLKVKKERLNKIMEAQQKITYRKNFERVGKTFEILVDNGKYGHAEFQTPEIDGKVIFSKKHTADKVFSAKITSVKKIYDLVT